MKKNNTKSLPRTYIITLCALAVSAFAHAQDLTPVIATWSTGTDTPIRTWDNPYTGSGAHITTSNPDADAVRFAGSQPSTLSDSALVTTGTRAHGINFGGIDDYSTTPPSRIRSGLVQLDNVSISTSGTGSNGLHCLLGNLQGNKVTVSTTGDGSALALVGYSTIDAAASEGSQIHLANSQLRSTGGTAILNYQKSATVWLDHCAVEGATAILDGSGSKGSFALFASATAIKGNVMGGVGSMIDLASGSQLMGNVSMYQGRLSIDATSSWIMSGSSTLGTLTNKGYVGITHQAANYGTLTMSNYVGGPGSVLGLNANLATGAADHFFVTGGTTGQSAIKVASVPSTGTPNGAMVFLGQAIGSNANTFFLAAPVSTGLYDYALASMGSSWFLRPNLDARAVVAPVAPTIALEYARASIGTYEQRQGAQLRGNDLHAGWVRSWGKWGDVRDRYDYTLGGVEAGLDVARVGNARMGVLATGGRAYAHVSGQDGLAAGTVDEHAYGVGVYGTLTGNLSASRTWYLDAVVRASRVATEANAHGKDSVRTNGYGLSGSAEAGIDQRIFARAKSWSNVGLQVQGVLAHTGLDNVAPVAFDAGTARLGRVGAAYAWHGRRLTLTATGNAWASANATDTTHLARPDGDYTLRSNLGHSWGEAEAEAQYQLTPRVIVWGACSYERAFDGSRDAWAGRLGMRVGW